MAQQQPSGSQSGNVRLKNTQQLYTCTHEGCKSSFLTNATLESHLRIHEEEKPFACRVCHKSFLSSPAQLRHEKNHSTRTYQCFQCDAMFGYCLDLSKHLNEHNNERSHMCSVCKVTFPTINLFFTHIQSHPLGNKNGEFVCLICGKNFTFNQLRRHLIAN